VVGNRVLAALIGRACQIDKQRRVMREARDGLGNLGLALRRAVG
jgi:hypothetical protein